MKRIEDRFFVADFNQQYDIDMILLNSACYIICQNTVDNKKIKELASFLHKEGVREINLFGAQKELWTAIFDQVDIESIGFAKLSTMMFGDLTATIGYESLDKFANELKTSKKFGNVYLFFDDAEIYGMLKQKLV